MKNFRRLRAGVALAALPLGLVSAAAVPVIAFGQSAPSKGNYETPMTDNAVDSTLMITALTMAGYDAKLISEGEQAPIIRVTRGQLDFTINFENCIFDGCTRARFTKTFGGDFSSSKTAAWNQSEESDAVADSGGAGKLWLDLKIFDPRIDTARFNAHVDVWLATLPRFETFVGGSATTQPTKTMTIASAEPPISAPPVENIDRATKALAQSFADGLRTTCEKNKDDPAEISYMLCGTSRRELELAQKTYNNGDYATALPLFKRVAASLDTILKPKAQIALGVIYRDGEGADQNEAEAIRYFQMAAHLSADARLALGDIYYAQPNCVEAAKNYASITDDDFSGSKVNTARYRLGKLYADGNGIAQNYQAAAKYFTTAANDDEKTGLRGNKDAQFALSALYGAGKGVTQSDAEAVKYLRMAARSNHTKAQFGLGVMFVSGKGVPQSMPIGYLWIARAAEDGDADAVKARDAIRARMNMTADDIAKTQQVVNSCGTYSNPCTWGD